MGKTVQLQAVLEWRQVKKSSNTIRKRIQKRSFVLSTFVFPFQRRRIMMNVHYELIKHGTNKDGTHNQLNLQENKKFNKQK